MELDNLKKLWREQDLENKQTEEADILAMLQKRSKSPIAKMKRNLLWELIIIVVMYSAMIVYYLFADQGRFKELSILFLVVGAAFIVYYQRKSKILKEMECVTCEVRSNLSRQLVTLAKYVRFYMIAGTVLSAVAYYIAGLVVFSKLGNSFFSSTRNLLIFIGIGLALTIIMIFVNKWYVNKLYGQHINRLKEILQQTEETV